MDQQHGTPHPLPPQGGQQPPAYPAPWGSPGAPPPPGRAVRRHRPGRLVIVTAVTALVTGAAGVGVGYAGLQAWQAHHPGTTTAAGPQGSTTFQQVPPGYVEQGTDGSGELVLPDSPFDQQDGTTQGGSSGGTSQGGSSSDTTSTASGSQLTGLVRIVSTMRYDGATAAGTGMVLTSDGEVVTNHHVVEGATSVEVKVMTTGKTYTADVVGTDASRDVAVLQLEDASGLATITPDTDGVSTGDAVTAVGDGGGTVDHLSAATGTVLAQGESITTQSEGTATSERLTDLVKISSDVVPGYSGGATYDADGKVVGMTTAASSGSSDVVGYAVPIATVLQVADDLENGVRSTSYTYGRPAFVGVGLAQGTTLAGVYAGQAADRAGMGPATRSRPSAAGPSRRRPSCAPRSRRTHPVTACASRGPTPRACATARRSPWAPGRSPEASCPTSSRGCGRPGPGTGLVERL